MPKEALLEAVGHDWPWPCHGFPEVVHSDNGVDFRSLAIRRGLDTYGVTQSFRPVRQPRFGALIERFIGTLMGELHIVPGTTFSNVQQRGEYDSDRKSIMSLDGFEEWVLLQISRYHRSPHRGLDGFTPQSRWEEAVASGFKPQAVPPGYAEDVLLAFLPSAKRQVSRTGIHFKRLRYWASWFGPLIRKGKGSVEIRFDPRDMSYIWVLAPTGWDRVHLYRRRDPFTLREHELALADLRAQAAGTYNEDDVHSLRQKSREVGIRGTLCLNAIRRLCNVHRMALLGFGTAAAMTALQNDEQLENRFEIFELRPLAPVEFAEFVELLSGAMPLRLATSWTQAMLERGYELTSGYVGRAAYLVQEASTQAVLSGAEQITSSILDSPDLSSSLAALQRARTRAGGRTRKSGR